MAEVPEVPGHSEEELQAAYEGVRAPLQGSADAAAPKEAIAQPQVGGGVRVPSESRSGGLIDKLKGLLKK